MKIKDYVIFGAIIIFCFWFFKPKGNNIFNKTKTEVVIERDTIWNNKTVQVPIIVSKPELVYIDTHTNQIVKDTTKGIAVNKYYDSLINDDISIYYTDIVKGFVIDKSLKYTLHVPKQINTTKTIYKKTNNFYLTGEVGGNKETFNNISLGLQFTSPKSYSLSYRYNLKQSTHNFGLGVKILNK